MIGIFDSGSGGLTVLRAIREEFPSCDVVYFGDIKNAPYGLRTQEELLGLTTAGIELLIRRGATKVVSACNSTSASLALSLLDATELTSAAVVEMVGPTVSYFKNTDARVLLCATPATVHSGIYQHAFRLIGKEIQAVAIPQLAAAIEFGADEAEIQSIIAEAFTGVIWEEYDAVVLACTHYPLVLEQFKVVVPPPVLLIDPAVAVAERVVKQFWPQEVGNGTTTFLLSAESEQFRERVAELFGGSAYTIEVLQ